MISEKIQVNKMRENCNGLLRLTSSVCNGILTTYLILKNLMAYPRQNNLPVILRELERIGRALYTIE